MSLVRLFFTVTSMVALFLFPSFLSFSTENGEPLPNITIDESSDIANIDYLSDKIDRISNSSYINLLSEELQQAEFLFIDGRRLYEQGESEGALDLFKACEELLDKLLVKEEKLAVDDLRERVKNEIIEAGRLVEKASFSLVINDQGYAEEGISYKFSFDTPARYPEYGTNVGNELSYRDIMIKAIEYLERAKMSFQSEHYENSLNYSGLAKKIALLFQESGIKEIYRVKRGDSLWKISERAEVYGSPFYWPLLYRANKKVIIYPDAIYPGQELLIPHFKQD